MSGKCYNKKWISVVPVAETQCAHPAAAFNIEASIGRGKGSGVSLIVKIQEFNLFPQKSLLQKHNNKETNKLNYPVLP